MYLFIFSVFMLLLIYAIYSAGSHPSRTRVSVTSMSLVTLEGQPVHIDSLLASKRTVFNFWAYWCMPCVDEIPKLDSLSRQLDQDRWQVILVSDESVEAQRKFRRGMHVSLPFLQLTTPMTDLGIDAIPVTMVIDTTGEVLYSKTGELTLTVRALRRIFERY